MRKLEDVKPGDWILYPYGLSYLRRLKVGRVTKQHILLEGSDTKYRVSSGYAVGSNTWNKEYIEPYDENKWLKSQERIKHHNMLYRLQETVWKDLPKELVQQMFALLPAVKKEE